MALFILWVESNELIKELIGYDSRKQLDLTRQTAEDREIQYVYHSQAANRSCEGCVNKNHTLGFLPPGKKIKHNQSSSLDLF